MLWRSLSQGALIAFAVAAVGCQEGRGRSEGLGPVTTAGDEAPADTSAGEGGGESGVSLDVGGGTGGPGPGVEETGFLWAANSVEGTVSKIDTQTGVEVARYLTGPMAAPDPSRTSVNLLGDVAIANRGGGIAAIAGSLDRCVDQNGDGQIQTSTGPADVLPFGTDECLRWHLDIPASGDDGARPVAWEAARQPDGEPGPNPRVWVAFSVGDDAVIWRIDGATGAVLDNITVPNYSPRSLGPYGGAVDVGDSFWILGFMDAPLLRIDAQTLVSSRFPPPYREFYGLALDAKGNPWIGALDGHVYHYDVASSTWFDIGDTGGGLRGVAVDEEGRAFIAGNDPCRLVEVDTTTRTVSATGIPLPGCSIPVGVSIDFEGFVWVVDNVGVAFKVDPDSYQIAAVVEGLTSPYTYSDMTGGGLRLVSSPPAG